MIQIPESVLKRNEERVERIVRKKEESGDQENVNDIFWDTFKEKQSEVEAILESAENTKDRQELSEIFNNASKLIQALNKYVSTSALILIPYDLRMTKAILQELQEKASASEKRLLPKRKFGFSKITHERKKEEILSPKSVDTVDFAKSDTLTFETGFAGRSGEILTLRREDLLGKDVLLNKIENCDIYLLGSYNTLQASQISGCRIFSGPASTSVFIDDCRESVFSVACQQLRVHETYATDFYIHVTTKAIIEDSDKVRFAPYTFSYETLVEDFHISGLDPLSNNWDKVDDFNWLVNSKQSPHWSVIDENDRVKLIK